MIMCILYLFYSFYIVFISLYIRFYNSLIFLFNCICFLLIIYISSDSDFFINIFFSKNYLDKILFVYNLSVTFQGKYCFFSVVLIGQFLLVVYTIIVSLNWGLFFIFVLKSFTFTYFLFYFLLTGYYFKYLFNNLSSGKIPNSSGPSSKTCYISFSGLSPRLKKLLKCFNSDINVLSFKCSVKEFHDLNCLFNNIFLNSYSRLDKVSFFNYVCGNVILDNIYKLRGINFVDRDYFLRHYNSYVLCKFHTNQDTNESYFCEGVCLDFSINFWLDNLNNDGTFNKNFLSYCDMFKDKSISKINVSIYIHDYNVLGSKYVFFNSKELVYSDVSVIKDLNSMDNKSVEKFISVNSVSLCLEFGLKPTDLIFINYNCKTGLGYEKFLRNGGSF